MRVTHPFHPLTGQQLVCVGERHNRYGTRLLLRVDEDHVFSVPPQWTDVVPRDPEVVLGGERSLFRVADLVALADLVARLAEQKRCVSTRKGIDAASVRQIAPHYSAGASTNTDGMALSTVLSDFPGVDADPFRGVNVITDPTETPWPDDQIGRTPKQRRSSRRGR